MILKQFKSRLLSAVCAFAALCMVSCTQDDDHLSDGTDTIGGDLQEYTLTIGIDRSMEGDTRAVSATEDDAPTRCFMQVFTADGTETVTELLTDESFDDGFTFTVLLNKNEEYTFCFWADNGTQDVTSLTNVPYTPGNIAFAYTTEGTPEAVVASGIKLAHAVAKVTLQSSTDVTIAENKSLSVTMQCAATYNALTRTASGTQDYATPETSGSFSANADVTSFYVLPTAETQSITLNAHLLRQTIDDVPLAANTHVTLQGDLSEDNDNWQVTDEYKLNIIRSTLFNEDGTPKGQREGNTYLFYGTQDDLNAYCRKVTRNPNFSVNSSNQFLIGDFTTNPHCYAYSTAIASIEFYDGSYYSFVLYNNNSYPAFPTID